MKSLKDFIESYGFECGLRANARANQLIDYFGGLPEGFEENPFKDWILEALNTHDVQKLIKAMYKTFNIAYHVDMNDKKQPVMKFVFNEMPSLIDIGRVAEFFGWYVTDSNEDYVYLAPTFPTNAGKYIHNVCKDHVYHICKMDDLDSILKNGLRCKTGRGRNDWDIYRNFPQRIYLIAAEPHDVGKAVKEIVDETGKGRYNPEQYSIIRIDEFGGDVYEDDAMTSNHAFFTYTNIPAKNIVKSWSLEEFLDKYCK